MALFFTMLSITACDLTQTIMGETGPEKAVTFGYVRPLSCTYQGQFAGGAGYDCVVKNFAEGPREIEMECANYDAHGRIMGRVKTIPSLTRVVLAANEERVSRYYFEPKAKLAVCTDIRNSIPAYSELDKLLADQQVKEITSVTEL